MAEKVNDICSICETKVIGDFCHNCGQKITGKKTGVKDILKALLSGAFSIERGILGILYELTVNPKRVIENYWEGNRFYFFSPGQLIFYTIFIVGLHIAFVSDRILGFRVELTGISKGFSLIFSPQLFFITLVLPLFAITTYLYFYKNKKSFPEHFISATYIFSYGAILWTILSDVVYLSFNLSLVFVVPVFLITLFVSSSRVFTRKKHWLYHLLNVLLQFVLFIILFLLLFGIVYLLDDVTVNSDKV